MTAGIDPVGVGAAAASASVRKRGRPKGSRTRKRAARDEKPEAEASAVYTPTDESVAMSAALGDALWTLSRIASGRRALTVDERLTLGRAVDPVLFKYLPALGDWAAETGLVITLWALWTATAPAGDVSGEASEGQSSATVLDEPAESFGVTR